MDRQTLIAAQQPVQGRGKHGHIGEREVQALGPGGRHDVRRIPGQEQVAIAHRSGDEAAHRRDALVQHRPVAQGPARQLEPAVQLVPDALVRPILDLVVQADLQVQAAGDRTAQAVQREATRMAGIDELVGGRRDVGQDAQPGVRILALTDSQEASGEGRAADAMEAVTAGDGVAGQLLRPAVGVGVPEHRVVGVQARHLGVCDSELDRCADG